MGLHNKISKNEIDYIIELKKRNLSISDISKEVNRCKVEIWKILKTYTTLIKENNKYNHEEVISFYKTCYDIYKTVKKFKGKYRSIEQILHNAGVYIPISRKEAAKKCKKTKNEHAFDEITPESAYWIGFLMADGWVNGNKVGLGLSIVDMEHINKFRQFLNSSNNLQFNKGMCSVSFRSDIISKKLISYGVTPRKSLTAKVCDELAFNRDFWRGVVDGDGSIGNVKVNKKLVPYIHLVGSFQLLTQFRNFIQSALYIKTTKICSIKNNRAYQHRYVSKKAVTIIEQLYSDSSVYLDRKKLKSKIIMEKI